MDDAERLAAILSEAQDARSAGRAPEIESLCREHPDLAPAIRRCLGVLPLLDHAVAAEAPPRPLPERFGAYRVLRELSRGGMGVVYLAEDSRIGRRVALKALAAETALSEKSRARMLREASLAGRLDHPNICTVYETGEEDGVPFIAMRYVEGPTLGDLVDRARKEGKSSRVVLPPAAGSRTFTESRSGEARREIDRLLLLGETVARALHVAHGAGLVHRDIKPSNVILGPPGEPVLLDFGLARDEEPGVPSLTETGALLGTPPYMSPEQITGSPGRPDLRTDVYSLGVALYECLTLRLPFDAPTRGALFQRILSTEAEDPRRLDREIPADLAVVLATAMEKDRERRYRTALAMAEDLRRVREREPILARPVPRWVRLGRWAQRNPAVAATAATLLLALGTGLGASLRLLSETRRERDAKVEALASARTEGEAKERALAEKDAALGRADEALAAKNGALLEKEAALAERGAALKAKEEALETSGKALRHARVLGLVHASAAVQEADPMESLQLAGHAIRREVSQETVSRLHEAVMGSLEEAILRGHTGGVNSVRFSPSGDRVLTASDDGTARIWDLSGRPLAVLRGHESMVKQAHFLPAGDRVFTVSWDGTARLWDPEGRELAVLRGHSACIHQGDVSASGDRLVTASCDGTARVWDASGREIAVLRGHQGKVNTAAFSPAGDRVVTAGNDGTARIWDLAGKETACLRGHGSEGRGFPVVGSAVFSPAGDRVLTLGYDGTARLWDTEGREVLRLTAISWVVGASFSPAGDRIFGSLGDMSTRVWDLEGRVITDFRGHRGRIRRFDFTRTGDRIFTVSTDGTARLWAGAGEPLAVFRGHPSEVLDGAISPDGSLAVTGSVDGSARLWRTVPSEVATFRGAAVFPLGPAGDRFVLARGPSDVAIVGIDGRDQARLGDFGSEVIAIGTPATRDCILVLTSDRVVRVLDLRGNPLVALRGHDNGVSGMDASLEKGRFITSDAERYIRLWDSTGRILARFRVGTAMPRSVAFTPSADAFSVGMTDGTIHLCDLEGRDIRVFEQDAVVNGASFSPSGDRMLSWGEDYTARLWDVPTGKELARFRHEGNVTDASLSPSGDRVLTCSEDGTIRLWDTEGRRLLVLRLHEGKVSNVLFLPPGDRALSVGYDDTSRIWLLDPRALLALAKTRSTRGLLKEEEDLYRELLEDPPVPGK